MSENFLTSYAAFAYGSDGEGKILLTDSGQPVWESQSGMVWVEDAVAFDSNEPAGYWMVNTGNPTLDAITTIAMNEMGADNFYRVVTNFRKGDYLDAAREAMFGIAEIGLTLTGIGKAGQAAVRSPRAFKTARAVAGQRRVANRFTQNMPGGFLNRSRTALFGGQYVDPSGPTNPARTVWRNGQRVQIPGGPALQTRPNAFRAVVDRYKNHGLGIRGSKGLIRGTVRSTAKAIRSGLAAGLPKGKRLGRLGLIGYPLAILGTGLARMNAQDEQAAAAAQPTTDADSVFDGVNTQVAEATATAQRDAAGIQQQYNNLLRELQGMYNLTETDEEKERLRFMLADIEAQRDAGLQAISEGYSKTVGDIRARAVKTRAEAAERATRFSDELTLQRDMSQQRMIDQQAAQVAANRGLGTAAGADPRNEWIELMSQYPGIQQRSTQRMGDITAEGIDWLADTTSAQGLAQQADLQRLAASTRSGVIAQQQQQVANRIAREQAEMRDAMMRLGMAGIAASQTSSAPAIDSLALREQIAQLGGINYSDRAIRNYFEPVLGRQLTPSELAVGAYEREQYLGRQAAAAAGAPVQPGS